MNVTDVMIAVALIIIAAIAILRPKKSFYRTRRWRRIRKIAIEENARRYGLDGACRCERCGRRISGKRIHVDHVWPRSKFRLLQYASWNLQVLCRRCNLMKSNRDGHHWRLLRKLRLHPIVWYLRWRQVRSGKRSRIAA